MKTIITIRKEKAKTKEGREFYSYKMNKDGKRVDLRFRQDSEKMDSIPVGISQIEVENLSESSSSFYPKYYCTFKKVVERGTSGELHVNDNTGEVTE